LKQGFSAGHFPKNERGRHEDMLLNELPRSERKTNTLLAEH